MERQGFNPDEYSLENYAKVIRKGFSGKETINYSINTVFQNKYTSAGKGEHFPVNGSIDTFFRRPNIVRNVCNGYIFYRNGFGFLKHPNKWTTVKADGSVNDDLVMHCYNGVTFYERSYSGDRFANTEYDDSANITCCGWRHLGLLTNACNKKYKHISFDKVIGIFINEDSNKIAPHRIYHTFSGGISLDKLSTHTALPIRLEVEKTLANGLKELEDNNISYYDCQPTNMRYDISTNKILLSPHSNIGFHKEQGEVSDISAVLYTNDWINNIDRFCKLYLGPGHTKESLIDMKRWLKDETDNLNDGLVEQLGVFWQSRKKILTNL